MTSATDRIEFRYAVRSMSGLTLAAALMTALSILIAVRAFPNVPAGSYAEFVGYVGVIFFGACTVIAGWRLISQRGPVVTLTRSGFRDVRLAAEEIPWSAISQLGHVTINDQDLLAIVVAPDVEAKLTLTRVVRWTREANRKLGIDALCTSALGLNTTFETLYTLSEMALRRAHGDSPEDDPNLPGAIVSSPADRF